MPSGNVHIREYRALLTTIAHITWRAISAVRYVTKFPGIYEMQSVLLVLFITGVCSIIVPPNFHDRDVLFHRLYMESDNLCSD